MMAARNVSPVELDCGHTLWFRIPPQSEDEMLYCRQCQTYRQILVSAVSVEVGWVYHAQWDFRSKKRKNRSVYDGECTMEGCDYECKAVFSFQQLRERMHKHYMRIHTENGGIEIVYADRYPRNSKPPF